MSHPVRVDEGCRNTVYNAIEQSGAEYLSNFRELGVSTFRVEFLEETPEQVAEVINLYGKALRGEISGTSVEDAQSDQSAWRYPGSAREIIGYVGQLGCTILIHLIKIYKYLFLCEEAVVCLELLQLYLFC